jgi:hypothetical protein
MRRGPRYRAERIAIVMQQPSNPDKVMTMTASPDARARASRRSSARKAALENLEAPPAMATANDASSPAESEALADEIEEAFGPADVVPQQAQERPIQGTPVSQANPAAAVLVGAASGRGGAIALPMEDLTRKIDSSDIVIPKLRLSQAMSKTNTIFATSRGSEGVGMGNWCVSSQNKNLGDTVYFIPVDMRKSRALFVQGQGLMCRSFDLLNGEGDPGGPCEGTYEERLTIPAQHRGCPLRLWNDSTPPKCGVTYNFPGYLVEDPENPDKGKVTQVILQLRSASTQAAKAINTVVMNEGLGVWQSVIIELGVDTKTNTKGTFFVPVVDFYRSTDDPACTRVRRRADAMARQLGAAAPLRASIEQDDE